MTASASGLGRWSGTFRVVTAEWQHPIYRFGFWNPVMQKCILLFGKPGALGELTKSRISGYTRKDGTFVAEHDDKRQAAAKSARSSLYPDNEALGPHRVGEKVSYKNDKGVTRQGKVKGGRDGKVVVEHSDGYTETVHHRDLTNHEIARNKANKPAFGW